MEDWESGQLELIARKLAEEDPRLGRMLERGKPPVAVGRLVMALLGALVLLAGALVLGVVIGAAMAAVTELDAWSIGSIGVAALLLGLGVWGTWMRSKS